MQIAFWFMILMVALGYIAQMTNVMAINKLLHEIKQPHDIQGKRIKTN